MTEEELENTRKLFKDHKGIDARSKTRWYHSVLDPEGKVLINFDTNEIKIRDKKLWEAFVSNTWISSK